MQINSQILNLEIEKLSNLGFGISKQDGFVVFIPNTCPGDYVKAKITKKHKSFAHAELVEIIKPSAYRKEPLCKMQKICGACQLQFIDYQKQLDIKKEIVSDTMHSIYGYDIEIKDVIPSPKISEYRCKIQYPISETKDSKRIIAGYYKSNSHDIVNIKYCPIQPEYCNKIIDFIRQEAKICSISGYNEKTHTGILRHVTIRASAYNKKNLVTLVINDNKLSKNVEKLAKNIYDKLENISGVAINFNPQRTNLIYGEKTQIVIGNDYIEEKLCEKEFRIGVKTFFQVNPYCADNIFKYVKEYIKNNINTPTILDAYAGISAFGICLSDISNSITTVEEVMDSVCMAHDIITKNNITNIDAICMDANKFFKEQLALNKCYDITLLDPPRKGCSKETLEYALKLTKRLIVYVSCNPATLARDLKFLKEKGAKIESIQPFDMFPHTYHIENVVFVTIDK